MNKRLESEYQEFIYKGEKTPISPGTLSVVIFCTVLLIVATFTKLDISHYWLDFSDGINVITKKYSLVPQVPVVLFSAAILGPRFGSLVVLLYLLSGFFVWPVFGFGGGIEYATSYFFGYILGFFSAVILSGKILFKKYNFKNMVLASIIGVLSIHLCGILYSFILSFFKSSSYNPDFHYISAQIIYDIVFSFIVILIAKYVKCIFWVAMKNDCKTKKENPKKSYIEEMQAKNNQN